ncbi:hypothetical protein [Natrinema marinum]|uniref:hypothetical protein n=1 Tax=Natrinema marinum TaxID=2961598 RepID=UPI0020C91EAA|nr:hypothetical protein [Natrinema marinum]
MGLDHSDFEAFELEHSLFELRVDGVPIWERIRFHVHREIAEQNGTGQAHTGVGDDWRDYLRGAGLFLKNIVQKNPYLTAEHDILFWGHHRRKKRDDGYWWDIYCDPIHECSDYDYVHYEKPHMLEHRSPARTSNLRYLDLIEHGGTIQQLLGVNEPSIPKAERDRLEAAQDAIRDRFDADVDLVSMAKEALHVRRTTLPLYRWLLKRVDAELAVIVVSYCRETFIDACKEQNVPVVELQHGVIYDHHFGYSFRGPRTKETFPDYLLTFGDFWKESVEFPIPDDRVFPIGYPYLEQSIDKYDDVETKDQLLFISQGTIGEQLSKFALEVDRHSEIDHEIVYKLHPGEYDRWETEYPWLLETDIEVVDSSDRQLYKLFAESDAQIGVGSTAVYEGLAFGLQTYIYDCPGSEVLEPLVNEGSAKLVTSVEGFVSSLGREEGTFDREYYFALKATEQARNVIGHLADNGTPYELSIE